MDIQQWSAATFAALKVYVGSDLFAVTLYCRREQLATISGKSRCVSADYINQGFLLRLSFSGARCTHAALILKPFKVGRLCDAVITMPTAGL